MESTAVLDETEVVDPPAGETKTDPEPSGESEPPAEGDDKGQVAPGSEPAPTVEDLQRQLSEAQKLLGTHSKELDFYRNLEDKIASDPDTFARVERLLEPETPPTAFQSLPSAADANGVGLPGVAPVVPQAQQPGTTDQEIATRLATIFDNTITNPDAAKSGMMEVLQMVQQRGAELGAQKALEQVAPLFQERQQAKQQAMNAAWDTARTNVQETLGIDMYQPEHKMELVSKIHELNRTLGFPENHPLPPEVVIPYAFREKFIESGKQKALQAEQGRKREAGAASQTVTPTPTPRAPQPKLSRLSDYLEHYRRQLESA